LLIRDALITDATPVGKFRRLRRAQLHQICGWNATAKKPDVFGPRQQRSRSLRQFARLTEQRLNDFSAELQSSAHATRRSEARGAWC
jgi:hypothetical protein